MTKKILFPCLLLVASIYLASCKSNRILPIEYTETPKSPVPDDESGLIVQSARYQQCVDRINDFRATEGKPPLVRWEDQEKCTDGQAKSDAEAGKAHGAFGVCSEMGQNECPGWGSVDEVLSRCLESMWNEKDLLAKNPNAPFEQVGHYKNMSSTSFTKVACGFYEKPDGSLWAIQNFQ